MARPAADYQKIIKDNRSSYNLIAHEHHVPQSPLFGPSPRQGGGDLRQADPRRDYGDGGMKGAKDYDNPLSHRADDNRNPADMIRHEHHVPASPLYRPGGQGYSEVDPRYGTPQGGRRDWIGGGRNYEARHQMAEGRDASNRYNQGKGHWSNTIGEINHLPVSPLYRPGQFRGSNRYYTDEGRQLWKPTETELEDDSDNNKNNEENDITKVPRPKEPPTPDYNTTQMHIPGSQNGETKIQLGELKGSTEDLRDYRTNNASWAGYQDQPVLRGPPVTDRPGNATDRSYSQ